MRRARAVLKSRREATELNHLQADDIFAAAQRGEKWAASILDEVISNMAIAVANLTVSFDPELIVLGGGVTSFSQLLVKPILQRIDGAIPTLPKLVASNLGMRATVMGAIVTVLHNTSNFYVVHKLS